MSAPKGYKHVATLCHATSTVCPEVFINEDADKLQQVMITDDFGGKIMISLEQLNILKDTSI